MAYRNFTLPRVVADFGLTVRTTPNLFRDIPARQVSPATVAWLDLYRPLATAINSEKARAELLITPMLGEAWRLGNDRVAFFSGVDFNVDPGAELVGVCDFILGRPPQLDYVSAPVMMITEAKNETIAGGFGQCAAELVAALRFNASRNSDITTVYGCVTNGVEWKFMRLRDTTLDIDQSDYLISDPDRILGIILHFVGLAQLPAAA